jgi:hypothetical protein
VITFLLLSYKTINTIQSFVECLFLCFSIVCKVRHLKLSILYVVTSGHIKVSPCLQSWYLFFLVKVSRSFI